MLFYIIIMSTIIYQEQLEKRKTKRLVIYIPKGWIKHIAPPISFAGPNKGTIVLVSIVSSSSTLSLYMEAVIVFIK